MYEYKLNQVHMTLSHMHTSSSLKLNTSKINSSVVSGPEFIFTEA